VGDSDFGENEAAKGRVEIGDFFSELVYRAFREAKAIETPENDESAQENQPELEEATGSSVAGLRERHNEKKYYSHGA
jgi:hypothetical protein